MINAFKYIVSSGGICKENDYAYLGYVRLHACILRVPRIRKAACMCKPVCMCT